MCRLPAVNQRCRTYFFEQIRPMVERALQDQNRKDWPLITLNLDFKSEEPEHLEFIWKLLEEYESWLCTAPRTGYPGRLRARWNCGQCWC